MEKPISYVVVVLIKYLVKVLIIFVEWIGLVTIECLFISSYCHFIVHFSLFVATELRCCHHNLLAINVQVYKCSSVLNNFYIRNILMRNVYLDCCIKFI